MKNHHFTAASLLLLLVGITAMSLAINPYFFAALFVVSTSHLLLTGLLCCVASTLSLTYARYRLNKSMYNSHIQKNNFDPCFIPFLALFTLCNVILPSIIGFPAIMLPFSMILPLYVLKQDDPVNNEQDLDVPVPVLMIGAFGLEGFFVQVIMNLFIISGASFTLVHCIIPIIVASIALIAISTAHSKLRTHNKMYNLIDNTLMSAQYCQIQGKTLKEHGLTATYDDHNQVAINITQDCAPLIRKMIQSKLNQAALKESINKAASEEDKQAILSAALTELFPEFSNILTSESKIVKNLLSHMPNWAQGRDVSQLEISNIVGNVVGASLTKAGIAHTTDRNTITIEIEDLENAERILVLHTKGQEGVNPSLNVDIVDEIGKFLSPRLDMTKMLEAYNCHTQAVQCDGNRAVT